MGKAVMGNEEGGKGHMNKKEKGHKKKKKEKVKSDGSDDARSIDSENMKHSVDTVHVEASTKMSESPCLERANNGVSNNDVKKGKKKRKKDEEVSSVGKMHILDACDENVGSELVERNKSEGEHGSKSRKRKSTHQDGETASDGSSRELTVSGEHSKRRSSTTLEEGEQVDMPKMADRRNGKKRRKESDKVAVDPRQNTAAGGDGNDDNKEREKIKGRNEGGQKKKQKDKGRRVSFTDAVQVFDIDGGDGDESGESGLVHAQRFTPEEDAQLMEAIKNYAEMKQLGDKGIEMVRFCRQYPEVKGCWVEIAKSLPHRPVTAVYYRARKLLSRSDERKWTEEEYEIIRRFVETNGKCWVQLAKELGGKCDVHVKDTWRRIKSKNRRKGKWTQDEYQNLFDLVNLDLRVKAHQQMNPGHRKLRDNISWEAISDKLTTRNFKDCCQKWYKQLTSPLVKQGNWADIDDYLMVDALQKVDAICAEDVDWDNLLEHRSGELCRLRWNQMVRNLGGHREKPFIEQVEVLSRRYCPEMLDYRK